MPCISVLNLNECIEEDEEAEIGRGGDGGLPLLPEISEELAAGTNGQDEKEDVADVELQMGNIGPFTVFLVGMPFVGVATGVGAVSAFAHGLKIAIKGMKIGKGKLVHRTVLKKRSQVRDMVKA
jgi:hypothetical protein